MIGLSKAVVMMLFKRNNHIVPEEGAVFPKEDSAFLEDIHAL